MNSADIPRSYWRVINANGLGKLVIVGRFLHKVETERTDILQDRINASKMAAAPALIDTLEDMIAHCVFKDCQRCRDARKLIDQANNGEYGYLSHEVWRTRHMIERMEARHA